MTFVTFLLSVILSSDVGFCKNKNNRQLLSSGLQLYVLNTEDNSRHSIDVTTDCTIGQLRQQISELLSIKKEHLFLQHHQQQQFERSMDYQQLADSGISSQSTIQVGIDRKIIAENDLKMNYHNITKQNFISKVVVLCGREHDFIKIMFFYKTNDLLTNP